VVGLLPITGIPLPLISSGGTSMALTMLVFGLLANFARHEPQAVAALRQETAPSGPQRGVGHAVPRLLQLRPPVPYSAAVPKPRSVPADRSNWER
jgi:cell division protein FtsW